MGKKSAATPVVDKNKASEANLNVIKRIDPDVVEVRFGMPEGPTTSAPRPLAASAPAPHAPAQIPPPPPSPPP
jgi:hypothetical protein